MITPWEFGLGCINRIIVFFTHKNFHLRVRAFAKRMSKKYLADGYYAFKEARLPLLDADTDTLFWGCVFEDIFLIYLAHDSCYDEKQMAPYYDDILPEGPYELRNDSIDVTLKEGDVLLDAGSWIGDFAAYASAKGALTYAFEPDNSNYEYLLKTAILNKDIYPVKKGLSNLKTKIAFKHDEDSSSGSHVNLEINPDVEEHAIEIEITTIDAFVQENNLKRVDFIKADIEGYERYMLEGAKETLKKFSPKLAICTYHLKDDPEVLSKIIKEANPAYEIVQKKKKLYAAVPK